MLEAGELAVNAQRSITLHYKDGHQALTDTDLAISKLAYVRLASWLNQPGHILLDEESIDQVGTPEDVFAATEYQWALDPIDGTAGYAAGRKLWGVSLGLLHKGVPVAGGIYLPAIGEMLLADDEKAWRIEYPDTDKEHTTALQCKHMTVNSQIFVESYFGNGIEWGQDWSGNKIWMNTPESAIQGFFSAITGQAAGAVMVKGFAVWDVAASAAIALRAGFQIKGLEDDRLLTAYQSSDFKPNWKQKYNWLISHTANFDHIKNALQS